MNDASLSYASGFVDGDGTLILSRVNTGAYCYGLYATNRDRNPLEFLRKLLGGGIYEKGVKGYQQIYYHYHITQRWSAGAALRLRPWLVLKQRQADLLIQFKEHVERYKGTQMIHRTINGTRFDRLPEFIHDERKAMIDQMKSYHADTAGEVFPEGWSEEVRNSYLAGLIDAEGSLVENNRTPAVRIGMVNEGLMELVRDWFGGSVTPHQPKQVNRKKIFHWQAYGDNARVICNAVLPYLQCDKNIKMAKDLVGMRSRKEYLAIRRPRNSLGQFM